MEYAVLCDIGKTRSINQDSVFAASRGDEALFVVADGMGGHSYGEKASRHIVKKMEQWWENFHAQESDHDFTQIMQAVRQAAEQANREIYEKYNQKDICGSTMVLLLIWKQAYGIIFAGDSRGYVYDGHTLRQLTVDEVWENQPCLTKEEKEEGWERNHGRLYNVIGIRKEMRCHVLTNERKPGILFLLCSDGLYKYCPERFIKRYLKKAKRGRQLQVCADALLSKVYESGAKDNISMILVRTGT